MATSTIKKPLVADAIELHDGTLASGFTGAIQYVRFGRIVVFSGNIYTTGALSNGQILASGFPSPAVTNNGSFIMGDNNSATTGRAYMSGNDLRFGGTAASASRSWRIYGAYLASSNEL